MIRAAEPRRATLDWREKGVSDFVTDVDVAAEAAIVELLARGEPGAHIVAEEAAGVVPGVAEGIGEHALAFIVDPLDGTTNFVHGFPEYAVSVAASVHGTLVAGAVLHVPRNELFTASAGGGAWVADTRLRVSGVVTPRHALMATGFPFKQRDDIPAFLGQLAAVMRGVAGVRRAGSAASDLAGVAAGRFEAFWENHLSPWDVAAGILLVREAGGVSTDFAGAPSGAAFGPIVAGNPAMHTWLRETLATSTPP